MSGETVVILVVLGFFVAVYVADRIGNRSDSTSSNQNGRGIPERLHPALRRAQDRRRCYAPLDAPWKSAPARRRIPSRDWDRRGHVELGTCMPLDSLRSLLPSPYGTPTTRLPAIGVVRWPSARPRGRRVQEARVEWHYKTIDTMASGRYLLQDAAASVPSSATRRQAPQERCVTVCRGR